MVKNTMYKELKRKVEECMYYYNNERIKLKLAGLSPVQHRYIIKTLTLWGHHLFEG